MQFAINFYSIFYSIYGQVRSIERIFIQPFSMQDTRSLTSSIYMAACCFSLVWCPDHTGSVNNKRARLYHGMNELILIQLIV